MAKKPATQQFEMVSVSAIQPHPENPRRGDTRAIEESITANGFYGACVVQRSTGFILVGNHRYEAGKRQGATQLPVIFVDVDEATALRILLVDNRANDMAEYDDALLRLALEQVQATSGSLVGTAFSDQDFEALLKKLDAVPTVADPASEPTVEPAATTFRIVIGPYRMDVPVDQYRDVLGGIEELSGNTKAAVIQTLKERLGL